jgi:hypothetical protein
MNADPTRTFWGAECMECWTDKKRWRYGCLRSGNLGKEVGKFVQHLRGEKGTEGMTAREVMEILTAKEEGSGHYMPKMGCKVEGAAPRKPNVYSDGSLENTKRVFLAGGRSGSMVARKRHRDA